MVIHQFNKLIRNKWVWGVFAVLVSLAFVAPDEWFRSRDDGRASADSRNKLDVEMDAPLYERCRALVDDFLPKFPGSPLSRVFAVHSDRDVWKAYAAATTFRKAGISVPDDVLASRIRAIFSTEDGGFDENEYATRVGSYFGVDPKTFEAHLRLMMEIETGLSTVAGTTTWVAPIEIDQVSRDFTDRYTVRVASFTPDKAVTDLKLDDDGLKAWFGKNASRLALPDRYRLRFVKFDAAASNVLARVTLSEDDVKARYDANAEKGLYDVPPATTNDVKTVKPLEDVRAGIEVALRAEAALELVKADVDALTSDDVYWNDEAAAKELLPKVAESSGNALSESGWIALASTPLRGLSKSPEAEFPGVKRGRPDVIDGVCKGDRPFGVVASDKAVWLIDLAEKSAAHEPTFEEAKDHIGDMALRDAKADAFKAQVEAVAKAGAEEVLKSANVTTNLTFAPCDFAHGEPMGWVNYYGEWDFKDAGFQNAEKVVFESRKLAKGEVSDFIPVGISRGLLVVCGDRKAGDVADLVRGERFARRLAGGLQAFGAIEDWLDANLAALGYKERPRAAAPEATDAPADED